MSLPGGCAIGARPVDQHIKGLRALGAAVEIDHGYVVVESARLKAAHIATDMVTVTGTENLMMAAVLAEGTTVIEMLRVNLKWLTWPIASMLWAQRSLVLVRPHW